MPIFRNFFFGKVEINRFEFLICYYSHLKDIEKKFLEKFNNLLLLLSLFEVDALKKSACGSRVILTLEDI